MGTLVSISEEARQIGTIVTVVSEKGMSILDSNKQNSI